MDTSPAAAPKQDIFLTPKAVCRLLSISRRTLRYWVKKNLLPAPLRLGPDGRVLRWHIADVVDYLKRARDQHVEKNTFY